MNFFAAMNHHDLGRMFSDQHVDVEESVELGDVHFSDVACRGLTRSATAAHLLCTFHETADPGTQTETFFTFDLVRSAKGYWFITGYGTG